MLEYFSLLIIFLPPESLMLTELTGLVLIALALKRKTLGKNQIFVVAIAAK